MAAGFSTPLVYYLNAEVYSDVGKTSEKRENMSEEEIMKQKVEDRLNSSIKKGFIFGSIALVDNFIGYFFIGILCNIPDKKIKALITYNHTINFNFLNEGKKLVLYINKKEKVYIIYRIIEA